MLPTLDVERDKMVYIPYNSDKGDCPYCKDGVLRREPAVERTFHVQEGYQCDTCSRFFIEGINFHFPNRHYTSYYDRRSTSCRYFVEVKGSIGEAVY